MIIVMMMTSKNASELNNREIGIELLWMDLLLFKHLILYLLLVSKLKIDWIVHSSAVSNNCRFALVYMKLKLSQRFCAKYLKEFYCLIKQKKEKQVTK